MTRAFSPCAELHIRLSSRFGAPSTDCVPLLTTGLPHLAIFAYHEVSMQSNRGSVLDYQQRPAAWSRFRSSWAATDHWLTLILRRSRARRAVGITIVALIPLGYVSSLFSLEACERDTAAWATRIVTGVKVSDLQPTSSTWPAEFGLPFMVDVPYSYTTGSLAGASGRRRYFCLFGWCIMLEDEVHAVI